MSTIIGNPIIAGSPLPSLNNPAVVGDVRYGKGFIDSQGDAQVGTVPDYVGQTDTGSVTPVDTGANGLYKSMIEGNVTEIVDNGLTALRTNAQYLNSSLIKVSLPNAVSVMSSSFNSCPKLTGIINLPLVTSNLQFVRSLQRTVVLNVGDIFRLYNESLCDHIWAPNCCTLSSGYQFYGYGHHLRTAQIDNCTALNFIASGGQNNNFAALVLRQSTLIPLSSTGLNRGTDFHFYVPSSLVNDYKTATNWVSYAQYFVGIDQDTTGTVGTTFTPTFTAQNIDHWDQVDLQSYSVGTVDSATGAITPTYDGRLLIRGLDSSNNVVHVTYLQIGTGFNEAQNLIDPV